MRAAVLDLGSRKRGYSLFLVPAPEVDLNRVSETKWQRGRGRLGTVRVRGLRFATESSSCSHPLSRSLLALSLAGYQEKACARSFTPQHGSHLLGVMTSGSSDRSHLVPFYPWLIPVSCWDDHDNWEVELADCSWEDLFAHLVSGNKFSRDLSL